MAPSSARPPSSTRGRPAAPNQRRRLIIGALVAAGLVVAGFLALRGGGDDDTEAIPELEHVHGLGVDPADGTLYVGTHYGLFRMPETGAITRVADRVQDYMGFTVAGPERFLASGHPGEDQGGPGSVGLIESTDAGESWTNLSLEGAADFHSLEFRHDRVYGLNSMSGEFMVSEDLADWDVRSTVPMADFAVSPSDPDLVLATTESGLARSTDGGATFALVDDAPLAVLVSWAEDGTLAAVTPEGVVYTASSESSDWQEQGDIGGPPEALTVQDADTIYAAAEGRILRSEDAGGTFTVRYEG